MVDASSPDSIKSLRRQLREARRSLNRSQQRHHANGLRLQLNRLLKPRRFHRIGLYLPFDGEIDPTHFFQQTESPWELYLPVVAKIGPMRFARWHDRSTLRKNQFGIPEPQGSTVGSRQLDAILMPLTAFNANGYRLGMGGGYYDYCLQHRRYSRQWRKPLLIGVAHELQQHDFPPNAWDIQPDWIATEKRLIKSQATVKTVDTPDSAFPPQN